MIVLSETGWSGWIENYTEMGGQLRRKKKDAFILQSIKRDGFEAYQEEPYKLIGKFSTWEKARDALQAVT